MGWGEGFFALLWHGWSSVGDNMNINSSRIWIFLFLFWTNLSVPNVHHEFSLHFGLLEKDHCLTTTAIIVFSSLCAWAVTDWVLNGDVRVLTLKLIVCEVLVTYVHCAFICGRRILRCFSFSYRRRANASLNNRQINLVLSSQPLILYQQKSMYEFSTWANTSTWMNCSICRHKNNGKWKECSCAQHTWIKYILRTKVDCCHNNNKRWHTHVLCQTVLLSIHFSGQ